MALKDRDEDPSPACIIFEVVGVVGTPLVTRLVRAVRGVGALMRDFLGVSGATLLLRLLLEKLEDEPRKGLEPLGAGLVTFGRDLLPMMKG